MNTEIEQFNAALDRLRVLKCGNYVQDSEWRDPSVRLTHIDSRLHLFLDQILGPVNRTIKGLKWYPWGSHYVHYGNLLCLTEAMCVLQERYGARGLLDLYENDDLCDAGLIPFFTGPDGWLYCIENTYLDQPDKRLLVIGDGARSERGVAEDARIRSAGVLHMSMAGLMEQFADHAERKKNVAQDANDEIEELIPPYSLIEWP